MRMSASLVLHDDRSVFGAVIVFKKIDRHGEKSAPFNKRMSRISPIQTGKRWTIGIVN